jgi:hypothetical protein
MTSSTGRRVTWDRGRWPRPQPGRRQDRYEAGGDRAGDLGRVERGQLTRSDIRFSVSERAGVVILFELRQANTKGMHMHDPDGNEVELFVDIAPGEPTQR